MKTKLNRLLYQENGITALESAIILIAFVVVAAIFAFTVLTTGTFLTERSKESAYAGLQEVRGSIQLKGSVVLQDAGDTIVINVSPVAGGSSVDLSKVNIVYRDAAYNQGLIYDAGANPPFIGHWIATNTAGTTAVTILNSGDYALISLMPPQGIVANQTFSLQLTPPTGSVLLIERTAPAQITNVTDLH